MKINDISITVKRPADMWQEIKDSALFTIGKSTGKYPTSEWKRSILMAEHSPIRDGFLIIEVYNVPSFVIGHFVRHHVGFTPYVRSLRSDRAEYDEVPNRNTPNAMRFNGNFQSFINVSRRRYCYQASAETRTVWDLIMQEVKKVEPELYSVCVKECVYRNGLCPEMNTCGFNKKEVFTAELKEYLKGYESQVARIEV